jgi:hypothetical protein
VSFALSCAMASSMAKGKEKRDYQSFSIKARCTIHYAKRSPLL